MATCRDCGDTSRWIHERKKADGTYALCRSCNRDRNKARQKLAAEAYRKKKAFLKRGGSVCQECGKVGHVELHHIIRLVDGGSNDDSNLILLCFDCHRSKHRTFIH